MRTKSALWKKVMKQPKPTIGRKLMAMTLVLLLVPSLLIGTSGYWTAKEQLTESGKRTLKNSVAQTLNMISSLNEEVEKGTMSLEDAQEKVKAAILGPKNAEGKRPDYKKTGIDIGEYGYIFIVEKRETAAGQRIMEVAHPSLEGQDITEVKSSNGKAIGFGLVELAEAGGGFYDFDFNLPNSDKVAPKITYVQKDPNWNWVICAGSYYIDYNKGADLVLREVEIIVSIAVIIGILLSWLFSRHISVPIKRVARQASLIASGDLREAEILIKNRDEIGQLAQDFNVMHQNLKTIIHEVSTVSSTVAATSEELSASADQTMQASVTIAGAITEVAESADMQSRHVGSSYGQVARMTEGIGHIADQVQTVAGSMLQTSKQSESGSQLIARTIGQMREVERKVNASSEVVGTLASKSQEINVIIDLIRQISGQTNLLALNAAIEAARAGEHGRGFAVVASEVRKLAEQSEHAAAQVYAIIHEMQQGIDKAMGTSQEGTEAMKAGLSSVDEAGAAFDEIFGAIEGVSEQAREVSLAVQELTANATSTVAAIEGIKAATEDISGNTQGIAASAEEQSASMEEMSAASSMLANSAYELQELVSKFKL
ncbi:methyl-accepting chemotaxis protein [Paenibacillus nanensis]|uniref:Methyl-accepting chemotaxis protein n=1 Tax=Paenibacillus nanensis TaxID=393251 RepID=A0A3A1URW7_9BACL|nr:methyl-accepting chemotaxis protein [Paenibacillus nanensis]RIX50161.1 methyl-accepting chemotaxis protein [Paenibacillus nanensis]